jgi:hypothetical protein
MDCHSENDGEEYTQNADNGFNREIPTKFSIQDGQDSRNQGNPELRVFETPRLRDNPSRIKLGLKKQIQDYAKERRNINGKPELFLEEYKDNAQNRNDSLSGHQRPLLPKNYLSSKILGYNENI